MAGANIRKGFEDGMTAYRAWLVDLPLAGMRWSLGFGSEQETAEAAWNGYDASMRLAKNAIDELYRNPVFAEWAASTLEGSLDGLLRWQQAGNALTRTLLAGLVQAAELPTRRDVAALRAEVATLRAQLRGLTDANAAEDEERGHETREARQPVVTPLVGPTPARRAA